MSKKSDAIKSKAKMLGYVSVTFFVFAAYLGLTHYAVHGTLDEIMSGVYACAICGYAAIFGMIVFLIIDKNILKGEEEEGCDNEHE